MNPRSRRFYYASLRMESPPYDYEWNRDPTIFAVGAGLRPARAAHTCAVPLVKAKHLRF